MVACIFAVCMKLTFISVFLCDVAFKTGLYFTHVDAENNSMPDWLFVVRYLKK